MVNNKHSARAALRTAASRRFTTLTRNDWVAAARRALESKGIAGVKVERLAKSLKVTRGSFYFHFRDRKDLLDALLEEWENVNCRPFKVLSRQKSLTGTELFEAVTDHWLPGGKFSPDLDMAVRDWGRTSRETELRVRASDRLRIELLFGALQAMGFDLEEALIRARVAYLHQIGYYAVHFTEPLETRMRYVPLYLKVLTGHEGWRTRSAPDKGSIRNSRQLQRKGP